MTRKAKPPLAPILYGKPQMFPSPTADPTAAIRKPKPLVHCPLLLSSMFTSFDVDEFKWIDNPLIIRSSRSIKRYEGEEMMS